MYKINVGMKQTSVRDIAWILVTIACVAVGILIIKLWFYL